MINTSKFIPWTHPTNELEFEQYDQQFTKRSNNRRPLQPKWSIYKHYNAISRKFFLKTGKEKKFSIELKQEMNAVLKKFQKSSDETLQNIKTEKLYRP